VNLLLNQFIPHPSALIPNEKCLQPEKPSV
jgi:hypothetical protein